MSTQQARIYRISVHGLSPTERTVFGGLTRLSDRKGIKFELDTASGNADIVILDGANQSSVDLVQFNPQIAQRTIWINPPEHLRAARQVRRPLRWPHLLLMVESMAGAPPENSDAAPAPPAVDMTVDQLCMLGESILRTHIGIAAEFVIDDVRSNIKNTCAGGNELRLSDIFLACLQQQLPKNVDAVKVIQQVSEAIAQSRVQ